MITLWYNDTVADPYMVELAMRELHLFKGHRKDIVENLLQTTHQEHKKIRRMIGNCRAEILLILSCINTYTWSHDHMILL